jgi:hypothetical protein
MTFLRMSLSAAVVLVSVSSYASAAKKADDLSLGQEARSGASETCIPPRKDGKTEFQHEMESYSKIQSQYDIWVNNAPNGSAQKNYLKTQWSHATEAFNATLKLSDLWSKKIDSQNKCVIKFNIPKTKFSPQKTLYCFNFANAGCTKNEIQRLTKEDNHILYPTCSTCDMQQGLSKGAYGDSDSPQYKIAQSAIKLSELTNKFSEKPTVANVKNILKELKRLEEAVRKMNSNHVTKQFSDIFKSLKDIMQDTCDYMQHQQPSAQVKD